MLRAVFSLLCLLTLGPLPLLALPEGLLFHASFDHMTTRADFAAGDPTCTLDAHLDFRSAEGVVGNGLMQEPGERCSYQLPGNLDTSRGSFSIWVKPLSWDGRTKKFRHFLAVSGVPGYRMLLYLYPVGAPHIANFIELSPKTPDEAIWRAGGPVDVLVRDQWTHLVSTWDEHEVKLYANGKRIGQGLVGRPIPKAETGVFTICPIEFWKHPQWSDPDEKTICDEVRVFDHPLSDDEVLDLYAAEVPGGMPDLQTKLVLELQPDYFAGTITLLLRTAHLSDAWRERLATGARATVTLAAPDGRLLLTRSVSLPAEPITVPVVEWRDGDYLARARLEAGGETLAAEQVLTKPPTPWLPRTTDWRATRVLEPWTPLQVRGDTVTYWNGEVELSGGLPARITSRGAPVLAGPIALVANEPATWGAPRLVEHAPYRVSVEGQGLLGRIALEYQTLMEFDGMVRCDLTLSPPPGGAHLQSLTIQIPVPRSVATWYRKPTCADWSGEPWDEPTFVPYGWLGNEDRGLSWFMESEANWRVPAGHPYLTLRPEGDAIMVRLHLISQPTPLDRQLSYTIGFQATPVRPLDPNLYARRWAPGPYVAGVNLFVYGWPKQISDLTGRLLARDPDHQRAFVDSWRARGVETLSYTCAQCTANISPEFRFFAAEWHQPYGATFAGYKRVGDDEPYNMVGVCPRSSFADFLVWCVAEHLRHDWGGGIYTDIDGAIPCDNVRHGCGFTDAFGRTGRTWPLYAHRALSRRIYEVCHDYGKLYFSHAHSNWYSLFNAFNDGWAPGEQYSSAVMNDPYFYMAQMPDRVWRSEFYSPTTGVATYLLPQIGRLGDPRVAEDRGPAESCFAAALVYGVPLWASLNRQVVEEVWAAQIAFGMESVVFEPFWRQTQVRCSNPQVRVSLYRKPGAWLVAVANFTRESQSCDLTCPDYPDATFTASWLGTGLTCAPGAASLVLPPQRGALLTVKGVD